MTKSKEFMTFRGDPEAYKNQLKTHEANLRKIMGKKSTLAEIVSERMRLKVIQEGGQLHNSSMSK